MGIGSIGNNGGNPNNPVDMAKKTIDLNYRYNKNVAIGTGIVALLALVSLVVLSILFPPFAIAFSVCVPLAATALALLAPISLVYGIRADRIHRQAQLLDIAHPQT